MADVKALAEELVNLTVKDVQELANILKEEYGIEPAAAAVAVAGPAAAAEAAPAEQTEFDVVLKSAGAAQGGHDRGVDRGGYPYRQEEGILCDEQAEERCHDNPAEIAERNFLLRAKKGDQPEKEGGSESAHGKERDGRNDTGIGDILGRDNVYSENRICRQKGQMPSYVPLSAHFAPPGLDEQSGHIPFMI